MRLFTSLTLTLAFNAALLHGGSFNPDDVLYRPVAAPASGTSYSDLSTLFDAPGYISGVTTAGAYLATNPGTGTPWWGQGTWGCCMVFDLGRSLPLTGMLLWDGNNYYGQAIWEIYIKTSDDMNTWTDRGWLYYDPNVGAPQWAPLPDGTNARYVQWSWYEDNGNGHSAHAYEMAFTGPAVPEPAGYALALTGTATLALLRRRRRSGC